MFVHVRDAQRPRASIWLLPVVRESCVVLAMQLLRSLSSSCRPSITRNQLIIKAKEKATFALPGPYIHVLSRMYSNGRYPDDLYSDAWNAQPYETPAEPRRDRHYRGQRRAYRRDRRREDPYGDYNYGSSVGDGPFEQSQSGYHDASSHPYYDAPSRYYRGDSRDSYYNGYTDGAGSSSSREHSRNGAYWHPNYDQRRSPSSHRDYAQNYNNSHYSTPDSSSNHYHHKMNMPKSKSKSKSKSPPPPSIPTSPSPSYLTLSLEHSSRCSPSAAHSPPSAPRKLLILDLNGTLLVRLRPSGPPYPRPYMPSFRDYLFAPATRRWLDVMVWSSAQPHNVERMVGRCFFDERLGPPLPASEDKENEEYADAKGEHKDKWEGKLVAVWARDTLGLSKSDYSASLSSFHTTPYILFCLILILILILTHHSAKKSQTTKDLSKPWSALSSSGKTHSALTTFLLDDSPAKVRLQPYNHVCISEYGKEELAADVEVKRRREPGVAPTPALIMDEKVEGEGKEGKNVRKKDKKKKKRQTKIDAALQQDSTQQERDVEPVHTDAAVLEDSTQHENNDPSQRHYHDEQQEREEAQFQGRAPIPTIPNSPIPAPTPNPNPNLNPTQPDSELGRGDQGEYESTLLAVIGILDALKYEGNVAGWIRAGGLWGGRKPQAILTTTVGMIIDGERASSPTDLELEGETEEEGANEAEEEAPAPPSSSPTSSQIKRQRSDASDRDGYGHDAKRTRFGWMAEEAPGAGNDVQTHKDGSLADKEVGTGANKETGAEGTKMWFEDEETVRYWVERGRAALRELGIEERDGVCWE